MAALNRVRSFLLFLNASAASRQSVEPLPPINVKASRNVFVKMGTCPDATPSVSAASNTSVDTIWSMSLP